VEVLRLVARVILELNMHPEYLGFLRRVVADFRQFPWIAEAFADVMDPQTDRLARYLAHLTTVGILESRNPLLAAHQFMGILNEFSLWPWVMRRPHLAVPTEEVIEETIRMFLQHYRHKLPTEHSRDEVHSERSAEVPPISAKMARCAAPRQEPSRRPGKCDEAEVRWH
jgi:hypothetical protein